jgi:hypothetical protein
MDIYREYVANPERCKAIKEAYKTTCGQLVKLNGMRNDMRASSDKLDPLIINIACENVLPELDLQPRLIIFGLKNGKSAYEDRYWAPHAERIAKAGIWATYAERPADIDLTADPKPIA